MSAVGITALLAGGLLAAVGTTGASAKTSTPQVLYVGTVAGVTTPATQTFSTIQAAVDAAHKGDWILVAPGDYHENDDIVNPPTSPQYLSTGWYGGVDIETSGLHLRGMNRNSVIVDGTLSTAAQPCSSAPADQNQPVSGAGRNGILVWKASNVSIENLTVCNFLAGPSGPSGNEIWWNGGGNQTGKIGLKGYSGDYLTATSTYFASSDVTRANVCASCATYGIFSSTAKGPGTLANLYANNMSDSGIYVGACSRVCGVTISNAWMENNALGYSGTNSGGQIQIQNSRFDNNKDGFDTNTALTGDPPPPQDGRCPGGTGSCWVFTNNLVDHNNNPNVPIAGTAGLGPTGTGMTISGGRNDTITDNTFIGNEAWGILFVPYPDGNSAQTPPLSKTCRNTKGLLATGLGINGIACLYDPMGDVLTNNKFSDNGTLGNPSNADFGNLVIGGHEPTNCFSGNTEWSSVGNTLTTQTGAATNANVLDGKTGQTPSACGTLTQSKQFLGSNTDGTLLTQAECDAGVLSGPLACGAASYPPVTGVVMQPLPALPSMPNPCTGAPANLWCPGGVSLVMSKRP